MAIRVPRFDGWSLMTRGSGSRTLRGECLRQPGGADVETDCQAARGIGNAAQVVVVLGIADDNGAWRCAPPRQQSPALLAAAPALLRAPARAAAA